MTYKLTILRDGEAIDERLTGEALDGALELSEGGPIDCKMLDLMVSALATTMPPHAHGDSNRRRLDYSLEGPEFGPLGYSGKVIEYV